MRKKRRVPFDPSKYTKYAIGGLFTNEQKSANEHPDRMGELDIPRVLLEDLCQQFERTGRAKVSLAGYDNISRDGERYITLTGKLPRPTAKTWHAPVSPNTELTSTETGGVFL